LPVRRRGSGVVIDAIGHRNLPKDFDRRPSFWQSGQCPVVPVISMSSPTATSS